MKIKNKFSAKLYCCLMGLLGVLLLSNCKKDESIEPLDSSSINLKDSLNELAAISSNSETYRLEKALPEGYVKDGSVDYTSYIQNALEKYSDVTFPAFPVQINNKGLTVASNKTLRFVSGSELRLKPTSDNSYCVLKIENASNVDIINPRIEGDLENHSGKGAHYGIGIGIYGSSYVTIYRPDISECWGDGIYIGRSSSKAVNDNIRIVSGNLNNNGRNGIAVISVDGLKLESPTASKNAVCGIGFMPDNASEEIKNISISNPTTAFNKSIGLQISLSNYYANQNKSLGEFTITNHHDIGSGAYAFKISSVRRSGEGYVSGTITTTNPVWEKPGSGRPNYHWVDDAHIKAIYESPKVTNQNGTSVTGTSLINLLKLNIRVGDVSITSKAGTTDNSTGNISEVPTNVGSSSSVNDNTNSSTGSTSSSYNIVNALPRGYVKDGSRDYTSYIQDALDKYSNITFPGFPIMVNDRGLVIRSNKTITFLSGSELRLKPTSIGYYSILNIQNSSNVVINDPVIKGDLSNHKGSNPHYGRGIGIFGCSNVTINNSKVSNCWGDGIYIGRSSSVAVNKNIRVINADLNKNGRNGMSVISVDGLILESVSATSNNLCGIDFEPDNISEEIKNITVNNPTTGYNKLNGLQVALSAYYSTRNKSIGSFKITNHHDVGSGSYAFKISAVRQSGEGYVSGTITTTNPVWEKAGSGRPNYHWVEDSQLKGIYQDVKATNDKGSYVTGSNLVKLLKLNIRKGVCDIR